MIIYGKEIDFKVTRANDAKALQAAVSELSREAEEFGGLLQEGEIHDLGMLINRRIEIVRNFFIRATGQDVLEGCDDMQEADKAYMQFIDVAKAQSAAVRSNVLYPVK